MEQENNHKLPKQIIWRELNCTVCLATVCFCLFSIQFFEKLKPLSVNEHTVSNIFAFAEELREMKINHHEVLVSYYVSSLFTNVPVDETIESITERAYENDWFNREHDLNITKIDLMELLRIATKNQLFQFEGNLDEQVDGVAMGSPLGPPQTPSCAKSRNNWKRKTSCLPSTNAM